MIEQMSRESMAQDVRTDLFGRDSGGLVRSYRTDDAETIVVAMGSVLGTIKDTIDEMRDAGVRIGVLGVISFRPFPLEAVRAALKNAKRVVVLEKTFAVGIGGILATDVRTALAGIPHASYTVVAGLGGRPILKKSLHEMLDKAGRDELSGLTFLDLDWKVVNKELERERQKRRSGPIAENILRDVNNVAAHGV